MRTFHQLDRATNRMARHSCCGYNLISLTKPSFPLHQAASAGHVGVAKILLEHGAGINTHSNEFKESALTLACYKGHLDMVRFLLAAGADREHKTDEMHTALMEASMDGHVEVARLLLDSGAQVSVSITLSILIA